MGGYGVNIHEPNAYTGILTHFSHSAFRIFLGISILLTVKTAAEHFPVFFSSLVVHNALLVFTINFSFLGSLFIVRCSAMGIGIKQDIGRLTVNSAIWVLHCYEQRRTPACALTHNVPPRGHRYLQTRQTNLPTVNEQVEGAPPGAAVMLPAQRLTARTAIA